MFFFQRKILLFLVFIVLSFFSPSPISAAGIGFEAISNNLAKISTPHSLPISESSEIFLVRPFFHSPDSPSALWDDKFWYGRIEEFSLSIPLTNLSRIQAPLNHNEQGILLLGLDNLFQWYATFRLENEELKLAHSRLIFSHPTARSIQIDWVDHLLSVTEWPLLSKPIWRLKSTTSLEYSVDFLGLSWMFSWNQATVEVAFPAKFAHHLGSQLDGFLAATLFPRSMDLPPHLRGITPSPLNFIRSLPHNTLELSSSSTRPIDDVVQEMSAFGTPEQLCSARHMVFVTASSASWFPSLRNLVGSIHLWQPEDQLILVYDLGLSQEQVEQVRSWQGVVYLNYESSCLRNSSFLTEFSRLTGDQLNVEMARDLSTNSFKPIVMFHALLQLEHHQPCIVWIDAGLELRRIFNPPQLLQDEGFFFIAQYPIEETFGGHDTYLPASRSLSFPKRLFEIFNISDPTSLAPRRFVPVSSSLIGISRASPAFNGLLLPWMKSMIRYSQLFTMQHGYTRQNFMQCQSFLNLHLYAPHIGFFHDSLQKRQLVQAGIFTATPPETDIHHFIYSTIQYCGYTWKTSCYEYFADAPHHPMAEPSYCAIYQGAKRFWGISHPIVVFSRRLHPYKPFPGYIKIDGRFHPAVETPSTNLTTWMNTTTERPEETRLWNGFYVSPKPPRYNLTICAVFRDEAPSLAEWIEYHLLLGVEHFWLYTLHHTDNWLDVLHPYIVQGIVSVDAQYAKYPRYVQPLTYEHCFAEHFLSSRWISFIDLDEFLVVSPNSQFNTMTDLLASLELRSIKKSTQVAGIALPWRTFGTSGHKTRPAGLQISSYTKHIPWPLPPNSPIYSGGVYAAKTEFKPILNTQHVSTPTISFWSKEGTYTHNPLGGIWAFKIGFGPCAISRPESFFLPLDWLPYDLPAFTKDWPSQLLRDVKLRPIDDGWYAHPHGPDYSLAWINHYFTRSSEEWSKQSKNLDFVTGFFRANPNLPRNGSLGLLPTPNRRPENKTDWVVERKDPNYPRIFDRFCTANDHTLSAFDATVKHAILSRESFGKLPLPKLDQLKASGIEGILDWSRQKHTQDLLDTIEHHYGAEERGGLDHICRSLQQLQVSKERTTGSALHVLAFEVDFAASFIARCAEPSSVTFGYPSSNTPWHDRVVLPNSEIAAFDSIHPFDWDMWNNRYLHLPPSITEFPHWDAIIINPLFYGWDSPQVISRYVSLIVGQLAPDQTRDIIIRNRPKAALPTRVMLEEELGQLDMLVINFTAAHNIVHLKIASQSTHHWGLSSQYNESPGRPNGSPHLICHRHPTQSTCGGDL